MAEYIEQSRAQAQAFIGKALKALADDEKISKATLVQIATAIGIVIDKWGTSKLEAPRVRGGVIEIPAVQPEEADEGRVVQL